MGDDIELLADFRRSHGLRPAQYPQLTADDRVCDCAGCGRLLLKADTAAGRRVSSLPPEVSLRGRDGRPYCPGCVRSGKVPGSQPRDVAADALEDSPMPGFGWAAEVLTDRRRGGRVAEEADNPWGGLAVRAGEESGDAA